MSDKGTVGQGDKAKEMAAFYLRCRDNVVNDKVKESLSPSPPRPVAPSPSPSLARAWIVAALASGIALTSAVANWQLRADAGRRAEEVERLQNFQQGCIDFCLHHYDLVETMGQEARAERERLERILAANGLGHMIPRGESK